jgi:hypothetical protein
MRGGQHGEDSFTVSMFSGVVIVKNICHNLASMSFKSSLVHYITYAAYSMFMKSHSIVPLAPRNNQTTRA